jgi:penicillin-binding protein 1A
MSTSPSLTETIKQKTSKWLSIERPWFRKIVKYTWILFFCIILGLPLYLFVVRIDLLGLFGGMPNIKQVENPENDLSSELISADGVSLGRYFRYNRSQVTYEELSDDLKNTLLISEDHRFYNHSGIDFPAYIRVAFGLITFNPQGGGSTITQQLAKILYTQNTDHSLDGYIAKLGGFPKRFVEKTKEWIISINLEENFTKEEIIAMYLNTASFGSNSFGIKVAAETYFDKEPDSLNLQESAILVGMLQNPSLYNPKRNPNNALRKRNEVLAKLYKHGYIKTREEFDSVKSLPIQLKYSVQNQNAGIATYFRTVMGNWLMDYCKSKGIDLWNSGLKIHTTIDSRMQRYAEEAVAEHMAVLQEGFVSEWKKRNRNPWVNDDFEEIPNFLKSRIKQTDAYKFYVAKYGEGSDSVNIMLNLKKQMTVFTWKGEKDTLFSSFDSLNYYKRFLQTGMTSIDPTTGAIKAWVGGINHKFFKYDHVKQAKRQPGSTFKPFVYGLAMESGYSPCQKMKDISPSFSMPGQPVWWPENSNGGRGNGEEMTIRQAMARSVNSITAQILKDLGPENIVEFAHRVGIQSKLEAVPSLCLGTSDVSLYELVGAYATYANSGIYTEPYFITRIEDKNGNVIENFIPKTRQAINEQTAYKMIYMLMGGVEERGGTSQGLSLELKKDNELGGKTGTTDNASDGWYVGVTHDLVSGVWVGGDERNIHFPSWGFGSGAQSARPIWQKFMLKVYADATTGVTKGQFKRPSSLDISLDCSQVSEDPDSVIINTRPWDINN